MIKAFSALEQDPSQQPVMAFLAVAQVDGQRWHIFLHYENGDEFLSDESWETEVAAADAAMQWAIENHIPGGKPN